MSHHFLNSSRRRCSVSLHLVVVLVFFVLGAAGVLAFPPAPPTTIYGTVRGELGYALDDGETVLLLLADEIEIARTAIRDAGRPGQNFKIVLPFDLNHSEGTYREEALSDEVAVEYVFVAERKGVRLPVLSVNAVVEAFVPSAAGRIRMDFTLGTDADGDGLPDAWERLQVESVEKEFDDPLQALSRDGDFDHDGLSDWDEYLAGTFALLFEDPASFRIVEVGEGGRTKIEFSAVKGKTYRFEASSDAKVWKFINLETSGATPQTLNSYRAATTQKQVIFLNPALPHHNRFYRLRIQ